MFELREFLKKGLLDAVGRKPTYWVVLSAAGWLEKGVLLEDDLKEIDESIEAINAYEIEPLQ
ncbi:MAG: hypothetical protein J6Q27_04080 [Clostridia bacterium]|nr:hypothetical protein [Clostridia bacterium]